MRLLINLLILGVIGRKNAPSIVYPEDPKHKFNKNFFSNDQVVAENTRWMERLFYHSKQTNFVNFMINLDSTIPLTPPTAIEILDETPYCWVILTYNSDTEEMYKEIKELAVGLKEYFYERCAVSFLDLGYPSNQATFGHLVSSPGIMLKKPNTIHKMFHHNDIHDGIEFFKVTELSEWGLAFNFDRLDKHLMDVITEIDQVYDNIHENYKVGAVFMDHYTEGVTSPKFYLNTVLNQILKSLQFKVFEKMMEEGFVTEQELKRNDLLKIMEQDEELYERFKEEINSEITSIDISKFLKNHMSEKIGEFVDMLKIEHKSGEKVDFVEKFHHPESLHTKIEARKPENFEKFIPNWLKLQTSLKS